MPTVFYFKGYRFYFFSKENDEPVHIHVEKAEASAKFWLVPEIREEYAYGFSGKQRQEIKQIIRKNISILIKAWHEHFK
jgi:Domain of unknown function (DUF4160)